MKQVLTIAGSDSGGGAGIQADIKAIQANGGYAMSVVTSITAQNTCEIRRAFDLPVDLIEDQIDAVFADFEVASAKTGMLSSPQIVEAVARKLRQHAPANLVVDPVMVSKSGFQLLGPDALDRVKDELFPLATLVTPNAPEAQLLTGCPVETLEQARSAAVRIGAYGCGAVLLKGGHLTAEEAIDVLWDGKELATFPAPRIDTPNTHGTGCTYSAAIATHLARGKELAAVVGAAKEYITHAIRAAPNLGHGSGPVQHFYFLEEGE